MKVVWNFDSILNIDFLQEEAVVESKKCAESGWREVERCGTGTGKGIKVWKITFFHLYAAQ